MQLIEEGKNIWDVYNKEYKNKISQDVYKKLASLDPTCKNDMNAKYLYWMVKQFINDFGGIRKFIPESYVYQLCQEYHWKLTPQNNIGWQVNTHYPYELEFPEEIANIVNKFYYYSSYVRDEHIDLNRAGVSKKLARTIIFLNLDGAIKYTFGDNISDELEWYDKHKQYLDDDDAKDIFKLNADALSTIYGELCGEVFTPSEAKSQIKKVYEDKDWIIYIPETYAAERYLVWKMYGGASWCTANGVNAATSGPVYFKKYQVDGNKLYVNVRKSDNAIFQYSTWSGEYNDKTNTPIDPYDSGISAGAIEYYESIEADIFKGTFPKEDDLFWNGYFGFRSVNDTSCEYALCNADGEIFGWMPHFNTCNIQMLYESRNCCLIQESDNDGKYYTIVDTEDEQNYELNDDIDFLDDQGIVMGGYRGYGDYLIYDIENNIQILGIDDYNTSFDDDTLTYKIIESDYKIYIFNKDSGELIRFNDGTTELYANECKFEGGSTISFTNLEDGERYIYSISNGYLRKESSPTNEEVLKKFKTIFEKINKNYNI